MQDQTIDDIFPCEYPLKVIGKADANFEITVLDILQKHVPDIGANKVSVKKSKKGNYESITVTFYATSKAQVDALYIDLSGHKDVIMTL